MGQVSITVNGRAYQVACDDGQEAHLMDLSKYLNQKVDGLIRDVGQIGDGRLMLMASLMIADELFDARAQLKKSTLASYKISETKLAEYLGRLSKRLSILADKAEQSNGGSIKKT